MVIHSCSVSVCTFVRHLRDVFQDGLAALLLAYLHEDMLPNSLVLAACASARRCISIHEAFIGSGGRLCVLRNRGASAVIADVRHLLLVAEHLDLDHLLFVWLHEGVECIGLVKRLVLVELVRFRVVYKRGWLQTSIGLVLR